MIGCVRCGRMTLGHWVCSVWLRRHYFKTFINSKLHISASVLFFFPFFFPPLSMYYLQNSFWERRWLTFNRLVKPTRTSGSGDHHYFCGKTKYSYSLLIIPEWQKAILYPLNLFSNPLSPSVSRTSLARDVWNVRMSSHIFSKASLLADTAHICPAHSPVFLWRAPRACGVVEMLTTAKVRVRVCACACSQGSWGTIRGCKADVVVPAALL